MSRNQRYIAFTRALDDLYIYSEKVDIDQFEKITQIKIDGPENGTGDLPGAHHKKKIREKSHTDSAVKQFFEENGLEVIDKRNKGGRLWVIGEKKDIREVVNQAIAEFKISGKYMASKEIGNRNGWCTKSDK